MRTDERSFSNAGFEETLFKAADNEDAIARTLEDRDEYAGENIFWVPRESRWETLPGLIDLFANLDFTAGESQGESEQDVVERVYEYSLKSFASLEGKRGGQFYKPPIVVRVLVEMLEPYQGRVLDPCRGSGGMFVQSRGGCKSG